MATLSIWADLWSHSHNTIYYYPTADSPPLRILPRWRVLYRITRQLLHRARCGSFSQKIETASWAKPANPKCFMLLCQLYFSQLSLAMPAKLNFFKTPASLRLVSSRTVSTSTGISGCYQQTQAASHAGSKVYIWNVFDSDVLHVNVRCALSICGLQLLYTSSVHCTDSLHSGMGRTSLKNVRIVSICVQVCLGIFPLCSWNTANNSFLSIHSSLFGSYFFISYFAASQHSEFSLLHISLLHISLLHISLVDSYRVFRFWTAVHWHLQNQDNFIFLKCA
jgi:hypothetical protein